MKRIVSRLSALSVVLLAAAAQAHPESGEGRLVGIVKDRTGGVLVGGTVEIQGLESNVVLSTATDAEGHYSFDSIPSGRYLVTAAAPGMDTGVRDDVVVAANADTACDFTLDVAGLQSFVEVTASAARPLAVETDPRTPRQPVPAHDGADYLKTVPGFSVIRKGGTDGDPILRGMAGSRLGILLDGESVLGGCSNRMDPPTAYAFPEAYDSITVLKGPQTVLHGPGNSAGVVLFEKERERFDSRTLRAYVSPTLSSFGRSDVMADVRAGARLGYVQASATRSASDDYQDGTGEVVHSSYERWSANAALGWTPDPNTRLELSGALSDGDAAYADRMMDGVRFSRENVGLRFERFQISRTLQGLEGQIYYNYVDHVMDNYSLRDFTPSMMMPNPTVSNPDRRTTGARLLATFQLSSSTQAKLGGDWQGNRHSARGSSNEPVDPYETHDRVRDAEFENGGAFGEVTQGIGANGHVIAGARADFWSGVDERTALSTGMGMSMMPNPTSGLSREEVLPSLFARYEHELGQATTLYAGLGHSQRAPDYWELVNKESADSLSAFETLPEKTTQLDVGALFRRGTVSGSVAFFRSAVSDFILIESNYPKSSTPMGGMSGGMSPMNQRLTTISRNVDASTWGTEATVAWEATSRIKLDTSLAYVRGENETDGLPLAQLPPLEGRVYVQYATDRWSFGALTRLVAAQERFALNQGNIVGQDLGPTDGFSVFSMNAGWHPTPRVSLTAGVDNLFDTTYAEFVSRSGAAVPGYTTTTRVNEPGRVVWVKLGVRY